MLRLGGADVKLTFLELLDNNIGPRGASALGMALTYGNNLSLLTLKLDYNTTLGDEGLGNLCKGIRTNVTLRQLHVQFCNITSQSGSALAELLANTGSGLTVLNVTGNRLGGLGLSELCKGLRTNCKLETIFLADNLIDQVRYSPIDAIKYSCQSNLATIVVVVSVRRRYRWSPGFAGLSSEPERIPNQCRPHVQSHRREGGKDPDRGSGTREYQDQRVPG